MLYSERLNGRDGAIRVTSLRPRHYIGIFLGLYILLECIVVGGSITPQTRGVYVAKLTYKSSDNTKYFFSDAITQLDVRVGYFSSCIRTHKSTTVGSWKCGRSENDLLKNDGNFNSTSAPDKDLYNFFENTAFMFRHDCLSPVILVVAIAISFLALILLAFQSPRSSVFNEELLYYKATSFVCFLAFSLSLVAGVWQETNTITGTKLMKIMLDDYYSLSTHYGNAARVLMWFGVCLTFISSLSLMSIGRVVANAAPSDMSFKYGA